MKHLFFVAVAIGILSGTSKSVNAQTSVNSLKFSSGLIPKNSTQFIEGIEIKREAKTFTDAEPLILKSTSVTSSKPTKKLPATQNCSSLQYKYAEIMKIDVESITSPKLYAAVDEWWATKYVYGGTGKRGIDCSALTGTLLKQAYGIDVPRTAHEQYAKSEKISRENLVEGDLVFFNTTGGVSHVGLYLANGCFVHASVHKGVTISSLNDSYYSKKYIGGGRLKPSTINSIAMVY